MLNHFGDISLARSYRRKLHKLRARLFSDNPRQCSLATARRPPKYKARRLFFVDDLTDDFLRADEATLFPNIVYTLDTRNKLFVEVRDIGVAGKIISAYDVARALARKNREKAL
jgi:hypothetical protein